MESHLATDDENHNKEQSLIKSILTKLPRPRKMVREWGKHADKGHGVEGIRDPWYFHRPLFNQLWQNLYLGVGDEGPKSIEMMKVPKQHLYYLSMLLHEALLKEDYIQAGYLMLAILRSPQHVPEQIWKGGLEVLKQCSPRMMTKTLQYQNLMSDLCPQYSSQMALDMTFHILKTNNDILEAYQYLTRRHTSYRVKNEPLLYAYLGMLEYALWKMDIEKSESMNECNDELETEDRAGDTNMHYYARKALTNMKVVLNEPGVWDVFVLKMVEILEYYKQDDETVSLLEAYREKNMGNPNAHRYLYCCLKKQNASSDKIFSVLKDLIALDPTFEPAFEYIEILKEKYLQCQVIDLIFLRLDHVACKNSLEDWKLLSKYYKTYKRDSQSQEWETLEKNLIDRKQWWPKYHFVTRKTIVKQEKIGNDEVSLAKCKRRISQYYKKIGKDLSKEQDINHMTDSTNQDTFSTEEKHSVSPISKDTKRKVTDAESPIKAKRKKAKEKLN